MILPRLRPIQTMLQFLRSASSTTAPSARFAAGRGLKDWDFSVHKKISLSESKYFQFRTDIFNLFNKTEFVNPDGNFSDTTFGQVLQARDPREVQFALKFLFVCPCKI